MTALKTNIRYVLFLWFLLIGVFGFNQTFAQSPLITQAEYFYDNDPGYGFGINIPIVSGSEIDVDFEMDVSELSAGFHKVYFRTKDENNVWGLTSVMNIYVEESQQIFLPEITYAEYFLDTDPGEGNGINIPVSGGTFIDTDFEIGLIGVSAGFHKAYFRTKDANNVWSLTNVMDIYVEESQQIFLPEITYAEYFLDTDPGEGNGINIPVSGGTFIDTDFEIGLVGVSAGFHKAYFRTKDENNVWSLTSVVDFYVVVNQQTMLINIPAGWSGISSYMVPNDPSVENIFGSLVDDMVILQNFDGMYWPYAGVNTIGIWNDMDGYQIKMETAQKVIFTGGPQMDHTLQLSSGWNYLPVLNACDNNVEDLFAPVIGHVQIVKEVAGWGVYWPQYGVNTLGDVVPGKAYFVLVDEDVEVEFAPCTRSNFLSDKTPSNSPSRGRTEPASQKQIDKNNQSDNSAVRSSVAALRVGTPLSLRRGAGGEVSPCVATPSPEGEGWGEVLKTPLTHTIAFPETILEDFEEGDFITIYNQNGLLCGAALVQNQNLVLTAFGDDPTTPQVDGLTEGEAMQFRVFNPKTGKEFPLEVKFDESLPQGGYFVNHGLSAVKGIETTGLEEMATSGINLSVYPNPSTGIFHVETQSGFETLTGFAWEISNTHGSIIAKGISQSNDFKIDISKHPKGIYYLKISQEELQTIKKLVLQ